MDNTIRKFFAEVGSRLPDTLAVTVAHWFPVFAFVWYSDLVDDIHARLWIRALVTVMPVASLFSKPKHGLRIWRWQIVVTPYSIHVVVRQHYGGLSPMFPGLC